MQPVQTMTEAPTNPYLAALTTQSTNPTPTKWAPTGPLKVFFDDTGTRAWTDAEKAATMKAFNEYQTVSNLSFELTTDRAQADLYGLFDMSPEYSGTAFMPWTGVNPIRINISLFNNVFAEINAGGFAYQTLVHEIGHAMGLYHPHGTPSFPGVPSNVSSSLGDNEQNQGVFSIMSYNFDWNREGGFVSAKYGNIIGPMAFDIAAIQFMYGVRAAETGDNVYKLPTINDRGTGWDCIWDTGGSDTITGAGSTGDLTIDLRAAPLTGPNAGGYVSWMGGIKGGFTIANGVTIENATGGSGNDTLNGNDAKNVIAGGTGNDNINGFGGVDIARVDGTKASAVITKTGGGITVTTAGDGTDTLVNIERVQLNDAIKAFDVGVGEIAGQAYRIYKAAFARTPDAEGLSFWLKQMDAGKSLLAVAKDFTFQQEYLAAYGTAPSAGDYVSKLYQNVLGRSGEAAGIAFWTQELTSGARDNTKVLADFTEIAENVTGVAASIADGFWYT